MGRREFYGATPAQHSAARQLLERRIEELDLSIPTRPIVDSAAQLALDHALRGYDALHAATALALDSPDLVVITGDKALLDALSALGLSTGDINTPIADDGAAPLTDRHHGRLWSKSSRNVARLARRLAMKALTVRPRPTQKRPLTSVNMPSTVA
jgi:hypothetical protein